MQVRQTGSDNHNRHKSQDSDKVVRKTLGLVEAINYLCDIREHSMFKILFASLSKILLICPFLMHRAVKNLTIEIIRVGCFCSRAAALLVPSPRPFKGRGFESRSII